MARQHKVKRYYGGSTTSFRAKPRLITIVLVVLLFVGLGYLGTVIYEPAYNFIMNIGKQPEAAEPEPDIEVPEASSEAPAEPEPAPPGYQAVRAAYAPPDIVADTARFDSFLDSLDASIVNAVMIDIKNGEGEVLYRSQNEQANKWGVIADNAVDLKAVAKKLEDKGLMLAVKMSVFRDPKAASAGRLDYAINYQNSEYLWLDNSQENGGKPWLNPYSSLTREYIEALMLEAIDAGAKLVALEDLRFPDNSAVYASFGSGAEGISRSEMLKRAVSQFAALAEERNARAAVYFPVTEVTNTDLQENRYGGGILETVGDFIMPRVQPSQFGNGYSQNGLEIADPTGDPAAAVKAALEYVKRGVSQDTVLIPVLDGGDKDSVSALTAVAKDLGIEEYLLPAWQLEAAHTSR